MTEKFNRPLYITVVWAKDLSRRLKEYEEGEMPFSQTDRIFDRFAILLESKKDLVKKHPEITEGEYHKALHILCKGWHRAPLVEMALGYTKIPGSTTPLPRLSGKNRMILARPTSHDKEIT